jgi:hypothetical protein
MRGVGVSIPVFSVLSRSFGCASALASARRAGENRGLGTFTQPCQVLSRSWFVLAAVGPGSWPHVFDGCRIMEFAIAAAAIGAMAKIADAEGRSAFVWGLITFGVCAASFAIPLPFLRLLLAFIVAFVLMMIAKARAGR